MDRQKTLAREARCIQDEPPGCTAACPVHVDVRGLVLKLRSGDLAGAAALYARAIPFPRVLSAVCDQPCLAACKRAEVDEAVAIRYLERACARPRPVRRASAQKRGTVAVVGGGLSGLTAAFELASKGYPVVLHEATTQLGGRLRSFPASVLDPSVLDEELAVLEQLGVTLRLGVRLGGEGGEGGEGGLTLEALAEAFSAVYLGTGPGDEGQDGDTVDPLTLETSRPGVFSGGGRRHGAAYSPIGSLADGRFAATSIDRLLQDVSLSASRERQGPFVTRLFTSTAGVTPQQQVEPLNPAAGFTPEEAAREARRCLACECLECVKVCPYLAHYGSFPKRYIREIATNADLQKGDHTANRMINSCALCGLCEAVCPEHLSMGEVCLEAREEMVDKGRMPPSAHDFALRDLAFSRGPHFALARHAPGTHSSQALFFPGCQLAASAPEQVARLYAHLREVLPGGVALHLGCCGAPAEWAGQKALFSECLTETSATWAALGNPTVITACSSCYRTFVDHLPEAKVDSLWTVLAARGLPARPSASLPTTLAIHDPCATRHDRPVQDAARALLTRLGVTVEEPALTRELTTCCGYGGLMSFANPAVADAVVDQRVAASPTDFVTYCAMCRDNFARRGKPSLHLLDLVLGAAPGAATRPGPGFSERHENRARLKATLLREVWGETPTTVDPPAELSFGPGVLEQMEARMILVDDVERTIRHAEQTGARFVDAATGHVLASHRPVAVTYWVEYSPRGAGFEVHEAYSHRMELKRSPMTDRDPVPASTPATPALTCARCHLALAPGKVLATYLGFEFPIELLCCPGCGQSDVPASLATGKMLQVEQLLEDK